MRSTGQEQFSVYVYFKTKEEEEEQEEVEEQERKEEGLQKPKETDWDELD